MISLRYHAVGRGGGEPPPPRRVRTHGRIPAARRSAPISPVYAPLIIELAAACYMTITTAVSAIVTVLTATALCVTAAPIALVRFGRAAAGIATATATRIATSAVILLIIATIITNGSHAAISNGSHAVTSGSSTATSNGSYAVISGSHVAIPSGSHAAINGPNATISGRDVATSSGPRIATESGPQTATLPFTILPGIIPNKGGPRVAPPSGSAPLSAARTPHIQNKNIKHPARYPPNPRLQTIGNDSLCQPLTTLIGGCASSHSQAVTGA